MRVCHLVSKLAHLASIAYWFDHVYKKLLNNIDVFVLKLQGAVTNEKVEHDLRWKRVLDVFSNNGQCTLIEPLRVMTVIHCQSGNNSIRFEVQYQPRTVNWLKSKDKHFKYWCWFKSIGQKGWNSTRPKSHKYILIPAPPKRNANVNHDTAQMPRLIAVYCQQLHFNQGWDW